MASVCSLDQAGLSPCVDARAVTTTKKTTTTREGRTNLVNKCICGNRLDHAGLCMSLQAHANSIKFSVTPNVLEADDAHLVEKKPTLRRQPNTLA